jgi:hypothetical protein
MNPMSHESDFFEQKIVPAEEKTPIGNWSSLWIDFDTTWEYWVSLNCLEKMEEYLSDYSQTETGKLNQWGNQELKEMNSSVNLMNNQKIWDALTIQW